MLNTKMIFLTRKDGSVELNPKYHLDVDPRDLSRVTLRCRKGTTGIDIPEGSMLKQWTCSVMGDELNVAEDATFQVVDEEV